MVKIIADSTCDLSKELIDKYDIAIIPLYVRLGDDEYLDGVNVTPQELYDWSDKNGETPKTAAASVADIMDIIEKNKADEYVIFTISASMSANNSNCRLAAEELGITEKVHVIDSQNLSTGIGLQIIEACELASAGKSGTEIEEYILALRDKVRASFVIDTLTYLYRGGRCSGLAALLGNALKLHPRIAVKEGAMGPEKKYRGLPKKYIMDYVKDMEAELKTAKKNRVFITHSGCNREVVEMVREYLKGLGRFDEILETRAGAVVSSHCGPGTLGVLFIDEA